MTVSFTKPEPTSLGRSTCAAPQPRDSYRRGRAGARPCDARMWPTSRRPRSVATASPQGRPGSVRQVGAPAPPPGPRAAPPTSEHTCRRTASPQSRRTPARPGVRHRVPGAGRGRRTQMSPHLFVSSWIRSPRLDSTATPGDTVSEGRRVRGGGGALRTQPAALVRRAHARVHARVQRHVEHGDDRVGGAAHGSRAWGEEEARGAVRRSGHCCGRAGRCVLVPRARGLGRVALRQLGALPLQNGVLRPKHRRRRQSP